MGRLSIFTKEQDDIIVKYYPEGGSIKCKEFIDKKVKQITCRAVVLGIKKIEHHPSIFTLEEDKIILNYYPTGGSKECIKYIQNKTREQIIGRARNLGIKVKNKGVLTRKATREQEQIIVDNYNNGDSCLSISNKVGLEKHIIYRILKKNKIKIERFRRDEPEYYKLVELVSKDYCDNGMSRPEICKKYNITKGQFRRLRELFNIPTQYNWTGGRNWCYGGRYNAWVKRYGKEEADKRFGESKNFGQLHNKQSNVNGIGWSGNYNGFYFRSLLELAYIIYLTRFGISFESGENLKYKIEYFDENGIKRNYFPDLVICNKYILEIKPKGLYNSIRNKIKSEAGDSYAKENGLIYKMITPTVWMELIIKEYKNNNIQFNNRKGKIFEQSNCFRTRSYG